MCSQSVTALAISRSVAGVAELVDAPDLGSGAYGVGVRVPSPAPSQYFNSIDNKRFSLGFNTLRGFNMHTITNTVIRNGSYYYNLRIPQEHVATHGNAVRFKLGDVSDCRPNYMAPEDVEQIVKRLTPLIMGSFRTGSRLDYRAAAKSLMPKATLLSDMLKEYLSVREISERPVRLAVDALEAVSGDREVADYTREDVRAFLGYMQQRGVKTATVRRRLNSLSAIFNYSYAELHIDKRNPFTRVIIPREGKDVSKRGVFTTEQLVDGYNTALSSGSTVKLLMPILGETGCRLAEIVGLRVEDVDLENEVLHIMTVTRS